MNTVGPKPRRGIGILDSSIEPGDMASPMSVSRRLLVALVLLSLILITPSSWMPSWLIVVVMVAIVGILFVLFVRWLAPRLRKIRRAL